MRMTIGELHGMDFGVHIHLLEEWNEGSNYTWVDEADVIRDFPHSTVIHQCSEKGELTSDPREEILVVAQYKTDGEGDIVSMVIFDRKNKPDFDYIGRIENKA